MGGDLVFAHSGDICGTHISTLISGILYLSAVVDILCSCLAD